MANFRIDVKRGRHHSVSIQSASLGSPLVDLSLSAQAALDLLYTLLDKEAELHDMVVNYYDCSDCGETHRKGETCAPGEES